MSPDKSYEQSCLWEKKSSNPLQYPCSSQVIKRKYMSETRIQEVSPMNKVTYGEKV